MKSIFSHVSSVTLAATLLAGSIQAQARNWEVTQVPVSENLTAVSFLKPDQGAVAGVSGSLFRFDGAEWKPTRPFGEQFGFSGVVVPNASQVWVCGNGLRRESRGMAVYSEEAWEFFSTLSGIVSPPVNGLWTHPESGLILAALSKGRIVRHESGNWSCADLNLSGSFLAVHGSDPKNVWAVGEAGMIYFSDDGGNTWMENPASSQYPDVTWQAVHTLAPDKTWIVGRTGEVAFWDGTQLTVEKPAKPADTILRGVFAVSPEEVYVVGSASGPKAKGAFLVFDGSVWSNVDVQAAYGTLNAIASDSDGTLYVAGNGGVILVGHKN